MNCQISEVNLNHIEFSHPGKIFVSFISLACTNCNFVLVTLCRKSQLSSPDHLSYQVDVHITAHVAVSPAVCAKRYCEAKSVCSNCSLLWFHRNCFHIAYNVKNASISRKVSRSPWKLSCVSKYQVVVQMLHFWCVQNTFWKKMLTLCFASIAELMNWFFFFYQVVRVCFEG